MQAVITMAGKDQVGIVADVSAICKQFNVNISDISQTLMQEYFAMIMLVNLDHMKGDFSDFVDAISDMAKKAALSFTPCMKISSMPCIPSEEGRYAEFKR